MSTLARLRDLELRYDGPIPPHLREATDASRRRLCGQAALLETQALAFLDAAVRCDAEIEELADDLAGRDGAQWQRDGWARKLSAARSRLDAHLACAAEAINRATAIRRTLAQPLHPLVRLTQLVGGGAADPALAGVEYDI